jgi:hypothetical protein
MRIKTSAPIGWEGEWTAADLDVMAERQISTPVTVLPRITKELRKTLENKVQLAVFGMHLQTFSICGSGVCLIWLRRRNNLAHCWSLIEILPVSAAASILPQPVLAEEQQRAVLPGLADKFRSSEQSYFFQIRIGCWSSSTVPGMTQRESVQFLSITGHR